MDSEIKLTNRGTGLAYCALPSQSRAFHENTYCFKMAGEYYVSDRNDIIISCYSLSYLLDFCIADILYLQDEDGENSDDGESMFLVVYIIVYIYDKFN